MIVIDGSLGEGGGQIFRTSLTLAMCLGKSVRIQNIRAGRSKPGLLRQHLTCLRAAQMICDAEITGDELGSREVTFRPGMIKAGEYRFSVGSAGSTSLVFQTVYMPLLFAKEVSEIYLEGGTHNGFAPSFDFIAECFLPAIAQMGYRADVELQRYGFYPAGGGAWRVRIYPVQKTTRLNLVERGREVSRLAVATSACLPEHITERELDQVRRIGLWPASTLKQQLVRSQGPGNILSLRLCSENVSEVVEVVGEHGVSAERVAKKAIREVKRYLKVDVSVGEYLADQLLLPMVLGVGGIFRTLKPSQHLLTNISIISQLMNIDIQLSEIEKGVWEVCV